MLTTVTTCGRLFRVTVQGMTDRSSVLLSVSRTSNETGDLVGSIVLGDPPKQVGDPDKRVDITRELIGLEIHVSGDEVVATIQLTVDLEFEFPVDRVAVASEQLDGLTSKELDDVIARGGFSTSPGVTIMEHLISRSLAGS